MAITFTVAGFFSNGQRRTAGLHWPGGANAVEFQQRGMQFERTFKREIQDAPTLPTGMPKFEYIDVTYQIHNPRGGSSTGRVSFAVTPKGLERLKKTLGSGEGANRSCKPAANIVDMTKFTNPNSFWGKMRLHVDELYKQAFKQLV